MNLLDWTVVFVYLASIIAMSFHLGRKQESVEDYYLGGNKLPWWAIALSTMATQCSSNSFLGTPAFVALAAGGGLVMLQNELALPLAMIFIILFMLPFFRRAGVISVYEYLEMRFGVGSRTCLSLLFQLIRGFSTGVTVYGVALVLEKAVGLPVWFGIILMGVVTIIYDTLGGMEAVVYSDVVQMAVLYGGVLLCVWYALDLTGGFWGMLASFKGGEASWVAGALERSSRFKVLNMDQWGFRPGEDYSFWAFLFGAFFLYVSYYGCDQSQVQRELASQDVDETNLSLFINGMLRFWLFLSTSLMGLAIGAALLSDYERNRAFFESVAANPSNQNQMVVHFVLQYLPHGVIGLIVVAIFAAAMSSLDSAINSLSATTMRDIYERFVESEIDAARHLFMSKCFTVFWGVFCTAAAFLTPYFSSNVLIAVNKVGSLSYGPILGVFVLGIFTRRTTDLGAIFGLFAGFFFNLWLWTSTEISWLYWNPAGFAMTLSVGYVASRLLVWRGLEQAVDDSRLEGLVYETGSYASFNYKRDWVAYCCVLMAAFVCYLAVCKAIELLPSLA